MTREIVEALRWHKFPVLDDGFVTLVDVMGDDAAIVQAARVSFGRDARTADAASQESDEHLLRYLMRHRHSTPFEMAEVKLLVRVPMDCWRQWIRHRTANVNEYSTRYAPAIDSAQATSMDGWRRQAVNNKQGSMEGELQWPEGYTLWPIREDGTPLLVLQDEEQHRGWAVLRVPPGHDIFGDTTETLAVFPTLQRADVTPGLYLSSVEATELRDTRASYEERVAFGVAREQARKNLPLCTYTEAYWKCDLHNILNFLSLRMDGHAQSEIRMYADVIGNHIIKPLFPAAWAAFCDYRLHAMQLSAADIQVLHRIANHLAVTPLARQADFPLRADQLFESVWPAHWRGEKCRERDECLTKLRRLGFVAE